MNVVALVGRMAADPQLRQTATGTSVCSFNIAVERRFANADGSRQADFITCVAWKNNADFICKYFKKGHPIAIHGEIQSRQYQDKSGSNRTATEVIVTSAMFVPKPPRQQAAAPAPKTAQPPAGNVYEARQIDMFVPVDSDEDMPF